MPSRTTIAALIASCVAVAIPLRAHFDTTNTRSAALQQAYVAAVAVHVADLIEQDTPGSSVPTRSMPSSGELAAMLDEAKHRAGNQRSQAVIAGIDAVRVDSIADGVIVLVSGAGMYATVVFEGSGEAHWRLGGPERSIPK
jgi:hypothetical protein